MSPIGEVKNRLDLAERPVVGKMQELEKKSVNKTPSFDERLYEAVKEVSPSVATSEIRVNQNIKEEIKADPYRKKLYEASVEFESIFVKMMLTQMKKGIQKTGMISGGYAEEIFEDMLYDEYAKNISRSENLGMAEEIYKTLSKGLPPIREIIKV